MAKKSNKPTKAIIALEITSNDAYYFYSYYTGQLVTAEKLKMQTESERKYIKQNLAKVKQLLTADQIKELKGIRLMFEKSFKDSKAESEVRNKAHSELNDGLQALYGEIHESWD